MTGIHDHSFDLRHGRSAVSVIRRLRPCLAPAPVQQRLCRGQPRARRRVRVVHDFGQNGNGVGAVGTREGLNVILCVCCVCLHAYKLTAGMRVINPSPPSTVKLQEILIVAAPRGKRQAILIAIFKEDRLAPVTARGHVMRTAWSNDACETSHRFAYHDRNKVGTLFPRRRGNIAPVTGFPDFPFQNRTS